MSSHIEKFVCLELHASVHNIYVCACVYCSHDFFGLENGLPYFSVSGWSAHDMPTALKERHIERRPFVSVLVTDPCQGILKSTYISNFIKSYTHHVCLKILFT